MTNKDDVANNLIAVIRNQARTAMITGVVMLVCGTLAIAAPLAAGVSITVLVGALLAIGGISECLLAFRAGALGRALLLFLLGALTAFVGFYMVSQPIEGLAAISVFLAAYFSVTGLFELIAAIQARPAQGWGLLLFNGIVTLILGLLIWVQLPLSGAWAVGVLFGIKLLMSGWWLIVVGGSARRATSGGGRTGVS